MGKELGRTVGGKLPFACWCVGMLLCECSLRFCGVPGTVLGPETGGDLVWTSSSEAWRGDRHRGSSGSPGFQTTAPEDRQMAMT